MFKIKEYYLDQNTLWLGVDGGISDHDLIFFQEIIGKYLDMNMKVFLNLTNLKQLGYEGKEFLQKVRDRVVLVDLPDYLKTEIENEYSGDSKE